jgi:hypothetical protein
MTIAKIDVKVGDHVAYLGAGMIRPNTGERLETGDVGRVIAIYAGEQPNPSLVVDEDTGETFLGLDARALVSWPNYRASLIWPDGRGKRWKPADRNRNTPTMKARP